MGQKGVRNKLKMRSLKNSLKVDQNEIIIVKYFSKDAVMQFEKGVEPIFQFP